MMFELSITNLIAKQLTFSHIIGSMQPHPAPVAPDIPGNGTDTIRVRLKKNKGVPNATADAVEIYYKRHEPGGLRWYSIHIDRDLTTVAVRRAFAYGLNLSVGQAPANSQGFSAHTTAGGNGPIKQALVAMMIHHGKYKYSFIM
jgi:hypothetical protein